MTNNDRLWTAAMVLFAVLVAVVGYSQVVQHLFSSWFAWPTGHIDSDSARTTRLLLFTRGELWVALVAGGVALVAARAAVMKGLLKAYSAVLVVGIIPPSVFVSFSRWGQDGTFDDVEKVPPVSVALALLTMLNPLLVLVLVRAFRPAWLTGE